MTSPQFEAPARQRIAKLMARVGLCSRRDAEAWIVDGRVSVNGELLSTPAHDVGPDDVILVDGVPLPAAEKTRLFLFHKPRGLVTSDRDPEGRATVADFLRTSWPDGPRVVTVGRLDINTEGLLLLTNDGGLARMLELPKTGWVRRYRVRAKGETDQAVLDGLRGGVSIDGVDYAGIEATLDRTQRANVWLTMGLREGKNREVKRVLEHIGLEVNRLIRLSFGPFQLGDLAEGAVDEVRTRVLRDQLGAALAAAAGVAFEDAVPPAVAKSARADRKPGRTAGAEQVNRGERPGREPHGTRQSRDTPEARGRGGDRTLRRPPAEAPPPVRERPAAGPRKHVSALRAAESETARRGPRRRVERSDLTDRRDRSVQVERLVDARPAPLEPTRARHSARRPERRDDMGAASSAGRGRASPSALAKRARTARSGGYGTERDEAASPRRRGGAGDGERADAGRRFGDKRPRHDEAEAPRAARRPHGDRDPSRPGAKPAGPRARRPTRGETREAPDGARAARPPSDGARRRQDGGRPDAPSRERPRRGAPSEGRERDDKRFDGERPGRKPGRAPRPDGARQGDTRRPDKRDEASRRSPRRTPGSGGASRPGGGKPPRSGGAPGRGRPRPKG